MKKMPCLFVRVFEGPRKATITREVTPGCEWVLAGEGSASIKRDGTTCAVIDGHLSKRYDAKRGKVPPAEAVPCDPEPDQTTGHWPHWVPVRAGNPADKWHAMAFVGTDLPDGTYELCGPHFQGNPEGLSEERFFRHGAELVTPPRDFDGLREFLSELPHEGIVFKHTDGRRCKLRRADFGLAWPLNRS